MALPFESLKTKRLNLIPSNMDYCDDIYREFTVEVARYMIPQPSEDKQETVKFLQECQQAFELATDLEVIILDNQSEEFLGCLGVLGLNRKTPSLGLWLKKSAWRKGYGQEAVKAILDWLKTYKQYRYILYPVDRDNIASRRLVESCGGVLDNVYAEKNTLGRVLNVCEYHIELK